MKNYNDFLKALGNECPIIKSFDGKYMKTISQYNIEKENKTKDIYYVVNSGSDKNDGITKFNAVFIDLDCGRDDNKQYYPLEKVSIYKQNKREEISKFEIKPTFIIETRNGLHVYWVLKEEITLDQWQLCMNKLIVKFDGDKQVNNPARLLRLPYTYWMKDKDNPFNINVLEFNNIKYRIDNIIDVLVDVDERKGEQLNKYINNTSSICSPKTPLASSTNYNVNAIKEGNIDYLHSILKPTEITFKNQNEFYTHITQNIDLYKLLGVNGRTFECVFHEDNNPSAGIFISKRNQYFYKCFSNNCGFIGNIIRCIERLRNCTRPQAINFIKQVYKITIEESEWQKEQKNILEENKRMIREGELEEYYPEIHKIIKRYEGLIYFLHDVAIDNIYDEKYSDENDNVVFFVGLKKIADGLNLKSHNKVADRVGLLAFLLMLNKLTDDEIPEKYLTKAKHIAAKYNHKSIVNFFSIPSYCDATLEESKIRANMFMDNNVTMKGWSRELLQRTFGEEIANEVYPQFTHRKISKKAEDMTEVIHKVVMTFVQENEYVLEKQIIETLKDAYGKVITEIQIKKSLQEILDTYDLKRIRSNKEIKNEYGISGKGYPFLIVKNKD